MLDKIFLAKFIAQKQMEYTERIPPRGRFGVTNLNQLKEEHGSLDWYFLCMRVQMALWEKLELKLQLQ